MARNRGKRRKNNKKHTKYTRGRSDIRAFTHQQVCRHFIIWESCILG